MRWAWRAPCGAQALSAEGLVFLEGGSGRRQGPGDTETPAFLHVQGSPRHTLQAWAARFSKFARKRVPLSHKAGAECPCSVLPLSKGCPGWGIWRDPQLGRAAQPPVGTGGQDEGITTVTAVPVQEPRVTPTKAHRGSVDKVTSLPVLRRMRVRGLFKWFLNIIFSHLTLPWFGIRKLLACRVAKVGQRGCQIGVEVQVHAALSRGGRTAQRQADLSSEMHREW